MSDLTLNKKQAQKIDMGQAEALLKKQEKKQADVAKVQMEREQFFTTYKKDQQESFQKENIFGKYNKLDSEVFPSVLNNIKKDREKYADSDLSLNDFITQTTAQLSDTLDAIDLKQKSTRYKNVYGYENKGDFNFKDYIFKKELLEDLKNVDPENKSTLKNAIDKIDVAIDQCDTIKNNALQHVSNENFKDSTTPDQIKADDAKIDLLGNLFNEKIFDIDCKDENISNIRKTIFHNDMNFVLTTEKERRKAEYASMEPTSHEISYSKLDKKKGQYKFDQNLQTIITNCQLKEDGTIKDFKNHKELRAFVDEMTVSIAQLIADFCATKYNIDKKSEGYRKLLIALIAQNQFYKENKKDRVNTLDVSKLGIKVTNQTNNDLKTIGFDELFEDKERLLNSLIRSRDFSAEVLAIEENRAYKIAGKAQATDLMDRLKVNKDIINTTEISTYKNFAKEIDSLDGTGEALLSDPLVLRNRNLLVDMKSDILKKNKDKSQDYGDLKSNDMKLTKLIGADKLDNALESKKELVYDDNKEFNLLTRKEIKAIGRKLSDTLEKLNAPMEGETYPSYIDTLHDRSSLYRAISRSADIMNDIVSESFDEISVEKGVKAKVKFSIDNKKMEELGSIQITLWNRLYDMIEASIEGYRYENPLIGELYSKGKRVPVEAVLDNNNKNEYVIAVKNVLNKQSNCAAYIMAYKSISDCETLVNNYRKSLENIIDKKSDVSDYYDGVSLIREKLVDLSRRIYDANTDDQTREDYKKAEEFKKRFQALREMQIVEPKEMKKEEVGAFREKAKIDQGKDIYNLLKEFDSFKTHIAESQNLVNTFAGRKLIEDVMKIQQEQSNRLVAEKKEELAYYEGNLLKLEINDFQKKNKSFGQDMKGDAAKLRKEFVKNYMPLKEKMTAYLDRYAELKNSTYYVKQVAVVQEAVDRQLKAMATDKLSQVYDKVMKDILVQDHLLQFDYSREANLSKRYKSFCAKLTGREKFGDFKDDVQLSNNAEKLLKIDISEEELRSGLDCMFSLSVISERMLTGGMRITDIMHNMSLPADITDEMVDLKLLSKVRDNKKLQNIAKAWIKEKADKLREAWEAVVNDAESEALNEWAPGMKSSVEEYEMAKTLGHYIAAQSPVAIQLEMLLHIGACVGLHEISIGKIKDSLDDLNADVKKYKEAGKAYGLTSLDSEIHEKDALEAYRELKIKNNVSTIIENGKKQCKENRDKELEGIEKKTITIQLASFEAIRSLYNKPSKYFSAVDDAMQKVAEIEAFDYSSVETKNLNKKLEEHKVVYENLLKATSEYIRTRSTWNHAFTDNGKKRLDAIKEVHKVAAANLSYFQAMTKHIADERTMFEADRLKEVKKKLEAFKKNPPQGNLLEAFNNEFASEICCTGSERLFNSTEGVEFFVELNQEHTKIKKAVVKDILANVDKIKYECAKMDVTAGKKTQFTAWARCYNYYNKFEKNCPEEAKEALQSLRTLSREYFNAKEAETILQEIKKPEVSKAISKYSARLEIKNQYTVAEYADMMRLSHKYSTFIAGVEAVHGSAKEISFIPEYDKFVSNFKEMKNRALTYFGSDNNKEAVIKESKIQLDKKIKAVREKIGNSGYIMGDIDTEVVQQIKEALEQIAFFFSLYSKDKMEPAFVEYYGAQRNNLQDILSANPTRMLLTEDYGITFDVKQEAATGYIAASDKMKPVDQRMQEYFKKINENSKNADATNEQKIAIRPESIKETIKYIVSVETEKNLLGGVAKVNKTSPEMANVLERQLAIRADFETRLKNRGKNKNKDDQKIRDTALKNALVNAAGDYFDLLNKKEISISAKNLPTEQERLMYYFVSFSKNFDEAKAFLDIVRTWQSVYGLDVRSTNLSKLEDIISRINFKTKETLQYNNLTQADQDIKNKINYMKQEAVLAQYSTQEVCDSRDADFAYTIQHLGDLKLNSVKSFRENDFVKQQRRFNGADNYKNLKVEKSWNLTIFGFTFWGKVDHSINDYAKRLLHYSKKYPELIGPMKTLLELKGYAQAAIAGTDQLTREESLNYFNRCIQSINKDIIIATSKASGNNFQSDQRRIIHMSDSDIKNVRQGWMEFYGILKELKLQLNDYMERHPIDEKKDVNAQAKINHERFAEAMREMNSGGTSIEDMEKRFFKILEYSKGNKYAESAFEHSANVEYSMYKNLLTSWFENYCFAQADIALEKIQMYTEEADVRERYVEFLKIIEKYDASHAISKKTYKYLKDRLFEACKAKFENFKDLDLDARAELRAQVVYDNVMSYLKASGAINYIPKATDAQLKEAKNEEERKLLELDFNKMNVNMAQYIQSVARQAAMLEARNTKLEAANEASEKALADSVIFLDKATEVLKKEGGWWFVLKDFVAYAVGNAQAAWYKVKGA